MREIRSPETIPTTGSPKIFLAGSIEMGIADEWQMHVVARLKNEEGVLLNPRRADWNASWKQDKEDPMFRQQVEWELNALEESDHIILYFDPHTKSPVSLLEMGLHAKSGKLLVVCPDGFWRKGNVDIVCEKYGILQFGTLDLLLDHLCTLIKK